MVITRKTFHLMHGGAHACLLSAPVLTGRGPCLLLVNFSITPSGKHRLGSRADLSCIPGAITYQLCGSDQFILVSLSAKWRK